MRAAFALFVALSLPAVAVAEPEGAADQTEESFCVRLADYMQTVAWNRDRGVTSEDMVDAALRANEADLFFELVIASAIHTVYVYKDVPVNEVSFKVLEQCQELVHDA